MCIANEQMDRRGRWLRAAANAALVAGLSLWSFARPAGRSPEMWFDGLAGLLMGFSIATNLLMVARSRCCNRAV
jgi:hypothetical protein